MPVSNKLTGTRRGSLFSDSISLTASFKVPYDFGSYSVSLFSTSTSYKIFIMIYHSLFFVELFIWLTSSAAVINILVLFDCNNFNGIYLKLLIV